MYRLLGIGVLLLWVSAMVSLFVRDVLPAWTAQEPPAMTHAQFQLFDEPFQQFSISDAKGRRLGTAWSDVTITSGTTILHGTIVVEGLLVIPPVRMESSTEFDPAGTLDSFDLNVYGIPMTRIFVRGERRGIYFPCEMQFGLMRREMNLDLSASRMIGESLRPFSYLPMLKVGQSWRMQILNPISVVVGGRSDMTSVIARVTGMETIPHPTEKGVMVECFVVQTEPNPTKAWVDSKGRVLKQEVEFPGLGRLVVQEMKYSAKQRDDAKRRIAGRSGPTADVMVPGQGED
jgi:hypothetical protein